jgi:general secretion pathway protein E
MLDPPNDPDLAENRSNVAPTVAATAASDFLAYLEDRRLIDAGAARRALAAHEEAGQAIDVVLAELGLLRDEALERQLSAFFNYPVIQRTDAPNELVLEGAVPAEFLRRNQLLLLSDGETVAVATADPFNTSALDSLSYYLGKPITISLVGRRDFQTIVRGLYQSEPQTQGPSDGDASVVAVRDEDIQRLKDLASEAPVIRLVNRLLHASVEQRASDIHIEPLPNFVRVRYRIDGRLIEAERLQTDIAPAVATRIKILAKLNIAERRMPQDGRIRVVARGREIDVRVSSVPTQHGESIVMRILDKAQIDLNFESLGLDGFARTALDRVLTEPNGIVLVTGPTGSGKTTTLYAALKLLNSADRKVFSVEDPIEYELDGINQMQVKPGIGLDFIHCLRAILRQDPDIIMLGEIRDVETARTAIQASLTGHLVLSTLHTNSAAASITRLIDMGVEDFLLASSLTGVFAQRLVRRLCTACSRPRRHEPALISRLTADLSTNERSIGEAELRDAVGCPTCGHTGFKGRTTISEAILINDDVRGHILSRAGEREIEAAARVQGMETLYQCGLRKAFLGQTTLEEVLRTARA